jgi:hypothetical protein
MAACRYVWRDGCWCARVWCTCVVMMGLLYADVSDGRASGSFFFLMSLGIEHECLEVPFLRSEEPRSEFEVRGPGVPAAQVGSAGRSLVDPQRGQCFACPADPPRHWKQGSSSATVPGEVLAHCPTPADTMGVVVAKSAQETPARCGSRRSPYVRAKRPSAARRRRKSKRHRGRRRTAFLLCPQWFQTCARRGTDGVQIPVGGKRKTVVRRHGCGHHG